MRQMRSLTVASVSVLCCALLAACTTANPGWTYQPAPSVTPAASVEATPQPSAGAGPGTVAITAAGIAFVQGTVTVPAGQPFQIEFTNDDAGTAHNVVIHKENAGGEVVFNGEIFKGVDTRTYDVPALDAGPYAFVCAVHPSMVGTLTAG